MQLVDTSLLPIAGKYTSSSVNVTVDNTLSLPTINLLSPTSGTSYLVGANIDVTFTTFNFEVPDDGGVIFKVNNGTPVFWESLSPYKVKASSAGTLTISAQLGKSVSEPLSNTEAKKTVSVTITSSSRAAGGLAQTTNVQPVEESSLPPIPATSTRTVSGSGTTSLTGKWKVVQNSSTNPNYEFTVRVEGTLGEEYVGATFHLFGSPRILLVEFNEPVKNGQFKDGYLYSSSPTDSNYGTRYDIDTNTTERIYLKATADEDIDLYANQTVTLIDSTGIVPLWCSSILPFSKNCLANQIIKTSGYDKSGVLSDALWVSSGNAGSCINLTGVTQPWNIYPDSEIYLQTMFLEPLRSFEGVKTTTDNGHYHSISMIGKVFQGTVASVSSIDAKTVRITFGTEHLTNYPGDILPLDYTMIEGAEAIFSKENNPAVSYTKNVVSAGATYIDVGLDYQEDFDFAGTNPDRIGEGFIIAIDARDYGITSGTSYDDFRAIWQPVAADVDIGNVTITIQSTASVILGDFIRVYDETGKSFETTVQSIPSGTTLTLSEASPKTFLVKDNPHIEILRDTYSNTHTHLVRNKEVEPVDVTVYSSFGYDPVHAHRQEGLIFSISSMLYLSDTQEIVVAGTGTKIYRSLDGGLSWIELYDITSRLEGMTEPTQVTMLATDTNNAIIAGTNEGFFLYQGQPRALTIELQNPFTDEFMPSSSSSSSESSSSMSLTSSSLSSASTWSSSSSISSSSET